MTNFSSHFRREIFSYSLFPIPRFAKCLLLITYYLLLVTSSQALFRDAINKLGDGAVN